MIQANLIERVQVKPIKKAKSNSLLTKYYAFCDKQKNQKVLWFGATLLLLPAALMPASLVVMYYFEWYLAFVAISILLFFANIIVTIAEAHPRITITLFFATILFNIFIPVLSLITWI